MRKCILLLSAFVAGCTTSQITEPPAMVVKAESKNYLVKPTSSCWKSGNVIFGSESCVAPACVRFSSCMSNPVGQIQSGNLVVSFVDIPQPETLNYEILASTDGLNYSAVRSGKGVSPLSVSLQGLTPGSYAVGIKATWRHIGYTEYEIGVTVPP
jgi:hypothetical protein